ncbi:MAG: cytochrome C oxidase subunit IV family protein [Myxococcales bacterium]|nr:cytochrome C oxidase subunit IV family protein [Myxococcales bacterium]
MSTHDEHAAHAEGKDHHHHVTPMPVYFAVFGALMVLTAITVWIAQFHFGAANTLVAMLVATIKASLVALIFMHLLYDERLNAVAFGFGLIFVALFFIFTLADVMTRGYIDPIREPGVMQNERVAALRLEYEKQFPVQSAFQPAAPGAGLPADERPAVVPDPSLAPGATPGAEGASPVEGAVPGVDGAEGAVEGAEGALPAEGVMPAEGAARPKAPPGRGRGRGRRHHPARRRRRWRRPARRGAARPRRDRGAGR